MTTWLMMFIDNNNISISFCEQHIGKSHAHRATTND